MEEQITLFTDNTGRYILGVVDFVTPDGKQMVVKNPALIVVIQGANGQVQIQTIPYFFKELLATNTTVTKWSFNKKTCAICTTGEISDALKAQYYKAISNGDQEQKTQTETKIVKLFDDNE